MKRKIEKRAMLTLCLACALVATGCSSAPAQDADPASAPAGVPPRGGQV